MFGGGGTYRRSALVAEPAGVSSVTLPELTPLGTVKNNELPDDTELTGAG